MKKKFGLLLVIIGLGIVSGNFAAVTCKFEEYSTKKGTLQTGFGYNEKFPVLKTASQVVYFDGMAASPSSVKEDLACNNKSFVEITRPNGSIVKINNVMMTKRNTLDLATEVAFARIPKDEFGDPATLIFMKNSKSKSSECTLDGKKILSSCEDFLQGR